MSNNTKYIAKERPWLYFMIFIIFCNTLKTCGDTLEIKNKIDVLEKKIDEQKDCKTVMINP